MKKKLLLITLMFLTLGKFAMASSRLPDGSIPDERLMRKLRSAVRLLASYYGTDKDMEGQADSRRFITKVMNNRKYNSYVPLAFNDVYVEDMEDWENAKASRDPKKIEAMYRGIEDLKAVRRQFGL